MPSGVLGGGLVSKAHQLGLVSLEDLELCWERLGTRNASDEEVINELVRQGVLTRFHVEKLRRGDTKGYFFGRYKILYKVASGSFARVYRAVDRTTGETAAVKVLRERWTNDPASVEAFKHEAQVGLMLRHPNIVRVDEVGEQDGRYYIGMEFVEGGNLQQFLKIRGKLKEAEAVPLMVDMLRGMAYAYDRGVTHRDLKLTNVLISAKGSAKLVDFGLATLHADEQKAEEAHGQRTVEYARLEKMTNAPAGDPRSDIFFLGCIFYEMITGVAPIPRKKGRADRMLRTRLDNIRPVLEVDPQANRDLAQLIDRMMALNPDLRYQTPHDVLADLKALGKLDAIPELEEPKRSKPVSASDQENRPVVLWMQSDPRLQQAIRDRLQKLGYRVLVIGDPERAFRRYRETEIDAVIVDCQTEGRAGLEAVKRMRDHARQLGRRLALVVLLTPDQADWRRELEPGANVRIVQKPATYRDLKAALTSLVPAPVSS